MTDPFYVYRPFLDLLGNSEGTAPPKGRGYNETLSYGAFTGGPVELVSMTLAEIDDLQTAMLKHPKNKWNSSAAGKYQIVRTTLRSIRETLGLDGASLFDARMQDRMGCYLLGVRGIDKWLAGRLSMETLMVNLSKEWASLPDPQSGGKSHYGNQRSSVSLEEVRQALDAVRARHMEEAPAKAVIPAEVEREFDKPRVKQKSFWERAVQILLGGGLAGSAWMQDWRVVVALGLTVVGVAVLGLLLQDRIVKAVRAVRAARA